MKFIIISIFLHSILFFNYSLLSKTNSFEIKQSGSNLKVNTISVNFTATEEPPKTEKSIENKIVKKERKTEEIKSKKEKRVEKEANFNEKKQEKIEKDKTFKKNKVLPTLSNNDFIKLSNGVYAAKNQGVEGLNYSVISQPDPEYPQPAKRIGYSKEVLVKVRFLVGLDGKIEEIKFYGDDIGLGFRDEVEKALKNWKFSTITVKNQKIKLYFYKVFKFNQK